MANCVVKHYPTDCYGSVARFTPRHRGNGIECICDDGGGGGGDVDMVCFQCRPFDYSIIWNCFLVANDTHN